MAEIFWHNLNFKEVAEMLKTDIENGLSEEEVSNRQKKFGKNKLPEEKPLSGFKIFLEQFYNPLVYILIIAGTICLILKEYTDAFVIFAAVFLDTIVGFIQENKASQILRELKRVVKYLAKVRRDGNLKIVDSTELVPGDIIILNAGDKVPADGRIIECENLKINEMALTGEWLAAEKNSEILAKEIPLADRDNMVYMGTIVEEGRGKVLVTATGIQTEIGKIATMIKETKEEKTPYQKKLAHFSKIVGIVIEVICLGIFIEGIITGGEFIEMFATAVAIAVSAIPEGLPVSMTVILALGMQRILKKKGLVRKLASTEVLGSTSVIATDKTATLTEGKMKVVEVIGDKFFALKIVALTSEAFIENPNSPKDKWVIRGKPTDQALLEAGIEAGFSFDKKKEFDKRKIADIPFNSINKFTAVLYSEDTSKKKTLYVCGAPEKILVKCNLLELEKEKLEKTLEGLTAKGLRVVASAYKELITNNEQPVELETEINNLTFVGFIALKDPIRKEAKKAIKICQEAGIKPIIVTGDHKLTAKAIAEEIGFKLQEENILEGKDLDKLSDEEFDNILNKIKIYARVEPKHKMRIIEAWQKKGEVVAMVGDGINDAPALKKADVGIALGSGTEVAKESSDLILLNDSFSIIVAAVEEGRAILDNIRKVITYLLSDSFSEVILVGVSLLAGLPLPITAVQILWINLVEDGLPDLALSFEPKEKDIMKRKPESRDFPLLTREMNVIIFIIGLITDLILLGLFFWLWGQNYNLAYIRTMIFACLTIDSILYVFSCKSLRRNLLHINLFSNRILFVAQAVGVLMLVLAIYLPGLQILLKTVPLGGQSWLIVLGMGLIELILIEVAKHYFIVRHQV